MRRLQYFDMIKGIAIFMVVMGHVLTMCVREIDRATIFKFIGQLHMPLFFFVSGWFLWRTDADGRPRVPGFGRRALQLLLPMVVVSTIWIYYFPHSGLQSPLVSTWQGLWSAEWKNGYWFTLVLFEIMLFYAATLPLLRRIRGAVASVVAVVAVWAVASVVVNTVVPAKWLGYTSFGIAVEFYPIVMCGAIARRHADGFNRLCDSSGWQTAALIVGAVLLYYVCWYWEFPWLPEWALMPATVGLRLAAALVAIGAVKPWAERAFAADRPAPAPLARMWAYIGTESLAVYLLHYFFLFPLGCLRPWLTEMNLAFVPLMALAALVAALIVATTLGANYIINLSRPLALLLTGKLPSRR